ncbi:Na+/H+ antiporter NhaA [Roseisolibacter agri]|uniref:Na(+)/H(+) antiporter NhaA n=1 Tax=Roseisolibacter agri TaxID=2014610 RepID=A0AA37VEJ0_9BACT|nr:Na+/H+ antiporter NhaA [Roseisolibacter agri]GLC25244.1 Na(+)/H(+) antiporter NhaA [Roseisolibacter agri]
MPALAPDLPPPLVERVLAPFRQFARLQSASGVVLLAAAVVAIAWANSPWAAAYHHLWETPLALTIGATEWRATLHYLVNDGLMAVFFFVVGLEIKREVLAGELSSARGAALPLVAALGGMVVPAAIYALLNAGGPGAPGWGIPMATDIAFALGVLALLGDRVPVGLKVFLAALAIADDIGAVLVIAIFYSGSVNVGALGMSAVLLLLAAGANRAGVRRPWAYGAIGLALWAAVLVSGVHATVAGVLLAFTIPVRTRIHEWQFLAGARRALEEFDAAAHVTESDPGVTVLSNSEHHRTVEELETLCEQVQPPLIRLEHALHGIVSFGIMPLFALANAGVTLDLGALRAGAATAVTMGAALGLLVGKPVGIFLFSWLAVRLGVGALPRGATWRALAGIGILGGIGFTMALFVAGLAFPPGTADGQLLLDAAKIGVLAASTVTGVVGWLYLRAATARQPADAGSPSSLSSSSGSTASVAGSANTNAEPPPVRGS